ncbi:MAG: U32 family peptidase [Francisella sp.]|jgi:peptidase U32|nr:MAG: U32 family peptidase [Francisella sp.]
MKAPELLLPAGGLDKMHIAFDYGADAVYAGLPRYSLRARNNSFSDFQTLQQGITQAHQRGKKFFVTANILAHNAKLKTFLRDLEPIIALKPDAMIMADPGLILKVKEHWPEMPLHLSVQANTTNYWGVQFWQGIGISRIILSRELSLEEIKEIRQTCPDIELEVFVHGALCIAYSGRCLLSGYFNHRDPNQGTCTNACRWNYSLKPAQETANGDLLIKHQPSLEMQKVYMLEESNRPGSPLPITEDEHGTYIMNSKDLRAIENVSRLVDIGVDSLKIEGRTKSIYYVARTAQAYRQAIDDALAHKPFDYHLITALDSLANRGYTSGFLERHPDQELQNYLRGYSLSKQAIYVGQVVAVDNEGWATIDVKNKFSVGDQVEVISPTGNKIITINAICHKGVLIDCASGNGIKVTIPHMHGRENSLLARLIFQE